MAKISKAAAVFGGMLILTLFLGAVMPACGGTRGAMTCPGVGSSGTPLPLGQLGRLGSWNVTVTEPLAEATQAALTEAGLAQPPSGTRYYAVTITATDLEPKALWFAAAYALVGPEGGALYPPAAVPSGVMSDVDAYPGNQVEVTLVFATPEDQPLRGTLLVTDTQMSASDRPAALFFSVNRDE